MRTYLVVIGVSILLFAGLLYGRSTMLLAFDSTVSAGFNVVSIMTTTGYATTDTDTWPMLTKVWLLILMFIGGCGGSTGGGIKVVRFVIFFKYAYAQIVTSYAPQRKSTVKLSGKPVSQPVIERTLSFFFLYLIIYAIGVTRDRMVWI